WPRALLRGRYMKAVATMERTGVPIDTELYQVLTSNWDNLKEDLITAVDEDYGVYEGTPFKSNATKATHKPIRERCKSVVLGVNYGMGPDALALQAGITPAEAKELLRLHKETYRSFW